MWDVILRLALILEAVFFGGGAIALYVLNYHVWPTPDPFYEGLIYLLGIAGYVAGIGAILVLREWIVEGLPKKKAPAKKEAEPKHQVVAKKVKLPKK